MRRKYVFKCWTSELKGESYVGKEFIKIIDFLTNKLDKKVKIRLKHYITDPDVQMTATVKLSPAEYYLLESYLYPCD